MKTVKGLHEKMGTFENANTSFHQAARCKRYTNEVLAFSMVKEEELLRATEEIQNLTYRQGEYKIFKVFEPKERLIMALPFYDRVIQQWVKRIEEFLENEMLLHINPKSTILYARNGIDFCGYIHYADHKKVRKSSIRKLKQDVKAYELGELPPEEFNRKYESRKRHLGHADTYHIAKAVEYELLFYEWERLEATA